MSRVFSPDDESIRWEDLGSLPEVGSLFFDLADKLADRPVSRDLDAAIADRKDENGLLIEAHFPAGFQVDPAKLLIRIAHIKHYRANRKAHSRNNVIAVSRLSGAVAEAIYNTQSVQEPSEAERLREAYQLIHRKAGSSYIDIVDPNYSEKNRRIIDIYSSLGKVITGYSSYFYEPGKG